MFMNELITDYLQCCQTVRFYNKNITLPLNEYLSDIKNNSI